MNTEREKQSEFMPPQLTARRSVRWRGLGMIVTGIGLAMLLVTVGTGEEPKSVVANGGNGTGTPTVSVPTRIAELSTQQAKNEKDLTDLRTQAAILSATPDQSTRIEVTVESGPNQPSINIGIDQNFNFPGGQIMPTPKPETIVATATPTVDGIATAIASATAEAARNEAIVREVAKIKTTATADAIASFTPTSTPTPTPPVPGPKPAEKEPPWGWIAGAFAAGAAITAELWNGFTRKKWFIIK